MLPTALPQHPWHTVGSDLFIWNGINYVLVVDYYSCYIEIAKLTSTTTLKDIITQLKSIFARHGLPQVLRSDNGPQYSSHLFSEFLESYGISHNPSSPKYPQANGEAERAVQTIKSLLSKEGDPYLALLSYRATPLLNGYSPAELLMGRKLRTTVPSPPDTYRPFTPNQAEVQEKEKMIKEKMKQNHDCHHRATTLKPLQIGERVRITDNQSEGSIVQGPDTTHPRSYIVQTDGGGQYRRNRRSLVPIPREVNTEIGNM